MTYSAGDLATLAAKLDALDLSDGERAALRDIFTAALADDEVTGFILGTATFSSFVPFFASTVALNNPGAASAKRTTVRDSNDRYA